MSMIQLAESEMKIAGFAPSEIETVRKILTLFFDEWDSGGAVWAMAPVLQRCIAGKCLTPLTGDESEWMDVSEYSGGPMWQNLRCGTVFKDADHSYDIDTPGRPSITFPYWPKNSEVGSPVIEIESRGPR